MPSTCILLVIHLFSEGKQFLTQRNRMKWDIGKMKRVHQQAGAWVDSCADELSQWYWHEIEKKINNCVYNNAAHDLICHFSMPRAERPM